jgi:hypothetical protein
MIEENIFSLLFKCARRQAENYFSKSFALVLSHLLNSNNSCKLAAIEILNEAFARPLDLHFSSTENISIDPHVKTPKKNEPDIIIEGEDKLIYVEIKVDSGVDKEARRRIRNYLNDLEKETRKNGLILVTKSGDENVGDLIPNEQQISWFAISGVLGRTLKELKRSEDPQSPAVYLLEKFHQFLQESGMAILKVEKEFDSQTVYNVIKLLAMIKQVFKELQLCTKQGPRFVSYPYPKRDESCLGYCNSANGEYGVLIYSKDTTKLYFEIYEKNEIPRLFQDSEDSDYIPEIHPEAKLWKEWDTIAVDLDLRTICSEEDVDKQREMLKDSINEIKRNWEKLKKKMSRKGS